MKKARKPVRSLAYGLRNPDPKVRRSITRRIARTTTVDSLAGKLLSVESPEEKAEIMNALGRKGSTLHIRNILLVAMDNLFHDPDLFIAACQAIAAMGTKGRDYFTKLILDDMNKFQQFLLNALQNGGDERVFYMSVIERVEEKKPGFMAALNANSTHKYPEAQRIIGRMLVEPAND